MADHDRVDETRPAAGVKAFSLCRGRQLRLQGETLDVEAPIITVQWTR